MSATVKRSPGRPLKPISSLSLPALRARYARIVSHPLEHYTEEGLRIRNERLVEIETRIAQIESARRLPDDDPRLVAKYERDMERAERKRAFEQRMARHDRIRPMRAAHGEYVTHLVQGLCHALKQALGTKDPIHYAQHVNDTFLPSLVAATTKFRDAVREAQAHDAQNHGATAEPDSNPEQESQP